VKINVKANLAPVLLQINTVKRQLPFVAARALTVTAQAARTRAITEMEQRFDRPKPYTTRQAMQVRKASKESLTAEVGIGVEYDAPSKGTPYEKVLAHHFAGGQRRFTKFEGALRRAGLIGSGEIVVPGGAAPLDPFGNLSQGTIVKLMSVLRLFTEQGYSANETSQGKAKREKVRQRRRKGGGFDYEVKTSNGKKVRRNYVEIGGKVYFVSKGPGGGSGWQGGTWHSGRRQHLAAGIWEKTGIHGVDVKPLVMFVRAGSYAQRFDLKAIVDDVFTSDWNRNFNESFRSAMVSAR
jgi:hypothetical protein